MNRKILIIVLSLFVIYSCQKKKENQKILARIGNTYITEDYLNDKIMELGSFDYLKTKIGKKQFLDVLINERLIKLAAESSNIASDKKYSQSVKLMEEELKKRLKEYKEALLTKMWLEKLRENEIAVTEDEIDEYLKNNSTMVTLEQIITTDYELAQSIMKQFKKGVSLNSIANKYKDSSDVVVNKLPPVIKGELLPEIEEVAFKLKNGEVGGIIKSKLGYHVIKKISVKNIDAKSQDMRERVRKIIEKKKFDKILEDLSKKYKVEVLDEEYK